MLPWGQPKVGPSFQDEQPFQWTHPVQRLGTCPFGEGPESGDLRSDAPLEILVIRDYLRR